MKPTRKSTSECIVELLKAMEQNAPISQIEFGYHPRADGSEPGPGDEVIYWAKARTRSGRVRMAEVKSTIPEKGIIDVLGELARELGLSVRIRYEEMT